MPQQTLTGKVISATNKTISVQVDHSRSHPIYRKRYNVSKKFHAHDEKNEAKSGDIVEIVEVPPISKQKRWKLVNIVEKSIEDGEIAG